MPPGEEEDIRASVDKSRNLNLIGERDVLPHGLDFGVDFLRTQLIMAPRSVGLH